MVRAVSLDAMGGGVMDNHRGKHDDLVGLLITLFIFVTPWIVFLAAALLRR